MKKAPTIKQDVFESIYGDIVNGVYPFDHVFNERELVEKYRVSRSPIRDALTELCSEKILRSIPRYGYEIVRVTERDVRDIARFRLAVEAPAFRENSPKYHEKMYEIVKEFNRAADENIRIRPPNISILWQANIEFHLALYSFTDNLYVEHVLRKAMRMMYRAYSQLYREKTKRGDAFAGTTNEQHLKIEACLAAGDLSGAAEALEHDISDIFVYAM